MSEPPFPGIGGDYGQPWNTTLWAPLTDAIYNGTSKSTLILNADGTEVLMTGTLAPPNPALPGGVSFAGLHTTTPLAWNLTGTDGIIMALCGYDRAQYTVTLANDMPAADQDGVPDSTYRVDWSFAPGSTTPEFNTTTPDYSSTTNTKTKTNTTALLNNKVQVVVPAAGEDKLPYSVLWHSRRRRHRHHRHPPPMPPHVLMPWLVFQTIDRDESTPPLLDLSKINRLSIMVRSEANDMPGEFDLCMMYVGGYVSESSGRTDE